MTAIWVEQSRALLGLRLLLWWRRLVRERQWGRAIVGLIAAVAAGLFSFALCAVTLDGGEELAARPQALAARGGPLAVFATWLTMLLVGRVWFSLMALGQSQAFLDPRRFRGYPVPPRLLSVLNLGALFLEPMWLVLYPPLVAIAIAISRLPDAPGLAALLFAEAFAVWATVGVLHLGAALGAVFDARPVLRRGFSVALLLAGFAGFQLSVAMPGRPGIAALFAGHHWRAIAWTPPGWTALLARSLSEGRPLHALTPALLLFILGLLCSTAAHALSLRELLRPPEPTQAPKRSVRSAGWRIPLLPPTFSALLEKEAKTVVRIGWLQLVLVPVAYLLLVRTVTTGPQPLLIAAVYANLGVLEISTNAFGRDLAAARAYFLWPVSLRELFAAKNMVAYGFSAGPARARGHLSAAGHVREHRQRAVPDAGARHARIAARARRGADRRPHRRALAAGRRGLGAVPDRAGSRAAALRGLRGCALDDVDRLSRPARLLRASALGSARVVAGRTFARRVVKGRRAPDAGNLFLIAHRARWSASLSKGIPMNSKLLLAAPLALLAACGSSGNAALSKTFNYDAAQAPTTAEQSAGSSAQTSVSSTASFSGTPTAENGAALAGVALDLAGAALGDAAFGMASPGAIKGALTRAADAGFDTCATVAANKVTFNNCVQTESGFSVSLNGSITATAGH
ncbi:MAG: hypothetical protein E6J88_05005, partial [Deltaproteobacteria bacterium]